MTVSRDKEQIRGLPGPLPEGERILWQGAPHWPTFARSAFHLNKVAVYFGLLLVWRLLAAHYDGNPLASALWPLPLAAVGLGIIAFLAWLVERTSVYTLTNRRIVMKVGIALPVTMNFPLRLIGNVDLMTRRNGTGDIPFVLGSDDKIAYLHLWPHARPWRFAKAEPMLRAIPDAARVAELLAGALQDIHSRANPAPTTLSTASGTSLAGSEGGSDGSREVSAATTTG